MNVLFFPFNYTSLCDMDASRYDTTWPKRVTWWRERKNLVGKKKTRKVFCLTNCIVCLVNWIYSLSSYCFNSIIIRRAGERFCYVEGFFGCANSSLFGVDVVTRQNSSVLGICDASLRGVDVRRGLNWRKKMRWEQISRSDEKVNSPEKYIPIPGT